MKKTSLLLALLALFVACNGPQEEAKKPMSPKDLPFIWENANVYFLLIDRFKNGNPKSDHSYGRKQDGEVLRSFEGGDIRGIIQKVEDGYFDRLGVSAIWFTPPIEQIHGATDEGTGKTYGYHGYWARDWTQIDANYGTEDDLAELVAKAHARGIRILMDVVVNHTGPVTDTDSAWPDEWARKGPVCTYEDAESTISCTLVENLPDIKTESDEAVELPQFLIEKWKEEGRYEEELAELNEFFESTGYPRAPRFYIIKWLTDYVRKHGIDGFRVDTAKHTEASLWGELFKEASRAFDEWKAKHPQAKLDDQPFFMTGEVYGYSIHNGLEFPMNEDHKVRFFDEGFKSLINFSMVWEASKPYEELFSSYSDLLQEPDFNGLSVMNYISSHDDSHPFDSLRKKPFESANKLLLAPGASQVYYGDETARMLVAPGAVGDANLRTFMNWKELDTNLKREEGYTIVEVLAHWQKLGTFRRAHVAVGAGAHEMLQESPYVFKRTYSTPTLHDEVIVALDLPESTSQTIEVADVFADGTKLMDYYSGQMVKVKDGAVTVPTTASVVLLGTPMEQ